MGRGYFYVVRISVKTAFVSILAVIVIGGFVLYGTHRRQRQVAQVSNRITALDVPAPDFTLLDTAGQQFSLETREDKGLVLVFWASWCADCGKDLQVIAQVHEQLNEDGDIALIGINVAEDATTVGRFATQHGLTFPMLLDVDASVSNAYSIRIVPSVVIIDEYGYVRERLLGRIERGTFTARLQSIVRRDGP